MGSHWKDVNRDHTVHYIYYNVIQRIVLREHRSKEMENEATAYAEAQKSACGLRAALLHKINRFRMDVISQDWADDKFIRISGSSGYGYVSADKVKRYLMPLFNKHGLELKIRYSNLKFEEKAGAGVHCTVKLSATLIDIDTGASETYEVYGEGSSTGDKSVSIAQTIALKQWVVQEFMIMDGVDLTDLNSEQGSYYRKSAEEQEEVRSKVLERSIKPAPRKEEQEEKQPEPAKTLEKIPDETPAEDPGTDVMPAPEETPVAEEPAPKAERKAAPKADGDGPNAVQKKVIAKITAAWEAAAKDGTATPEEYNAMSMACAEIANPEMAAQFITTYRR